MISETNGQELLLEQINLVEKEDHVRILEPLAVANRIKQLEALLQAVVGGGLIQREVEAADVNKENHCRHILKAVNPLVPL